MKVIKANINNILWPNSCCRCGSQKYDWKIHSEKVVIWTVISVTKYRVINLNIPICKKCENISKYWLFSAAALAASAYLIVTILPTSYRDIAGTYMAISWLVAAGMVIKSIKSKPLNILGYEEKENVISLKIYNDLIAEEMAKKLNCETSKYKSVNSTYLMALLAAILLLVVAVFVSEYV